MTRDPHKRTHPQTAFPEAKSVLTLAVSYYQEPFPKKPGPGYGRVARYAWGADYHPIILNRLQQLLPEVQRVLGSSGNAFLAVDTKPLLERSLAEQSGIGFVGKNTVLIVPRSSSHQFHVGSWIFLAEILLDIEIPRPVLRTSLSTEWRGTQGEARGSCGSCTKCLTSCPTDAFDGPYKLRANKCISYLTIENKEAIPTDMRDHVGDWLFGCDICQDVCPFNSRAFETRWPELKSDRGVGAWIALDELLALDDAAFKLKFGHTPLSRPKRRGLLRNACVVAGNSGDRSLLPHLKKLTEDPEPLIREHAAWAVDKLTPQ